MSNAVQSPALQTVIERDVIKLSDALVHASVTSIDAGGRNRIAQAGDAVKIDLSAVTRVDSSALALLMGWQRHAHRLGKTVALVSVPSNLAAIMQLTGADGLFEIVHG